MRRRVWRYADQILRVIIDTMRDEELKSSILITEIYLKECAPVFRMVHHDPENRMVYRDAFRKNPPVSPKQLPCLLHGWGLLPLPRIHCQGKTVSCNLPGTAMAIPQGDDAAGRGAHKPGFLIPTALCLRGRFNGHHNNFPGDLGMLAKKSPRCLSSGGLGFNES